MRFILALFAIAVTFMLIIRSSEVIELLLNFTAVEFISLLDNVAFRLASTGFFGRANYDEAVMVRTLSFKIDKRKRTYSSVKFLSMLVIFLVRPVVNCARCNVFTQISTTLSDCSSFLFAVTSWGMGC